MAKLTKKKEAEILKRYRVPKTATPEEAKKINRNKTAALWRARNPEKVRAAAKAYNEKRQKAAEVGEEQFEGKPREGAKIQPLSNGPQLMYDALSYGSKVSDGVRAAWLEAEANNRQVIGLIKDFTGDILGPYLTLTGFTQAIQSVYGEGIRLQMQTEIPGAKEAKKKDKKATVQQYRDYPMITSAFSDDGVTVYITVTCEMMAKK